MARQKPFEEPADDVPAWVMTFSDVITLLMTFFILLLTFATNTPETFDRLQVTMFGGGGSTGFVSEVEGMDRDELLTRMRARVGRTTAAGSAMPPLYSDPTFASLEKNFAGLETDEENILSRDYSIKQRIDRIVDADGNVTALGKQQLRMLGDQMRRIPLQVSIHVSTATDLDTMLAIAEHLTTEEEVNISRIGIAVAPARVKPGQVDLTVTLEGASRGEKN